MTRTIKAALVALLLLLIAGCAGAPSKATGSSLSPDLLASKVETLQLAGPPANRINLVLLGDGYRTQDQDKLTQDAQNWLSAFRCSEPFSHYASYFNVKLVHLVSREDGAGNGMFGLGVPRATALGATFQNASPAGQTPDYRLLVVDNARAQALAMALTPECTQLLVLVNDANYGGSGGTVPTFSANPESCSIALHEFGHAFGGLADEYQCGDTGALPSMLEAFPNVTALRDLDLIKWRTWINPGTVLPTPATWAHATELGLFEGAYFHDTGVFRARLTCRMRSLTDAFCEVCSEAIVNRIHDQVRLLDGASPSIPFDSKVPLSLAVTRPVPNPDTIQVAWTVDGAAVAGDGDRLTLPAGSLAPGAHQVSAHLIDATPLVRNGTASRAWVQTWTLGSGTTAAPVPPSQQHQVLRILRTSSGFEVVERRIVDLPLPPGLGPGPSTWQVEALGLDGRVQFQAGLEDPTQLRGEFQHAASPGRIQGYHLDENQPVSFLVRMPVLETRRLDIFERRREGTGKRRLLGRAVLGAADSP